jgi:hypothetical protein
MTVDIEYFNVLRHLYDKSLILEDINDFQPVLWFYFLDAMAHIDYTLCSLAFNYQSVRNIMNLQYLRWRLDEETSGDRRYFPAFINWLKENHPDRFDALPLLWQEIYDAESPAQYMSFKIVLDPDSRKLLPPTVFIGMIDELFSRKFLGSIYRDASLGKLFDEFVKSQ